MAERPRERQQQTEDTETHSVGLGSNKCTHQQLSGKFVAIHLRYVRSNLEVEVEQPPFVLLLLWLESRGPGETCAV